MKYITQKTIDLIQATARKDNKVTFLLGNGVNSQFEEQGVLSWGDLMEDIAKTMGSDYESIKDLLPTERYSALALKFEEKEVRDAVIIKSTREAKMDSKRLANFNYALKKLDCPVLTTNIDSNLDGNCTRPMMLDCNYSSRHRQRVHSSMETLYKYWGDDKLNEADKGYGVWHINGHYSLPETIRFGLSDYGKLCGRVFELTHSWHSDQKTCTWLDPFLKNPLCIIGLDLNNAEFFIRWLLLRKAHILKKEGKGAPLNSSGWYCYVPKKKCSKEWDSQKRTLQFLRTVNIEPVPFKNYDSIYLSLFDIK